ncbi:MAG: AMP-binding protein [Dermatophilaceae bacterium]
MPETAWVPDGSAWERAAGLVDWDRPFETLWRPDGIRSEWFVGGLLNASTNCVDRHAAVDPDRIAIRWEGEPGDERLITYAELLEEVSTLARALRGLGVGPADVVALHLGGVPEIIVAMLACARIGAVHAILPTPLPGEALADRLEGLAAKVLFTQDGAWRHGTVLPLKARADEALTAVAGIEHTIVVRRTGIDVAWFEGDRWYHDLVAGGRSGSARAGGEAVPLPSDHPLLRMNLANRGGRPVIVTHGAAGLIIAAATIHEWGVADGDTFWCAGDVSWQGVATHGIYGPLARGATTVLYEGTLDVPTHARAWEIMRRHGVTTLLTTPSVLRTMRGWAAALPDTDAPATLRRIVTFGESAESPLREWAGTGLGRPLTVADGWGQIELGGIVHVDHPIEPDLLPSTGLAVVDAEGGEVPTGHDGELVLTRAWAGEMLPATGAVAAATDAHWTTRPGWYVTGDRVRRDAAGRLEFLGRTDEVVSLHGQLVSISEVKQALLDHPFVRQADVIERRDAHGARYLAAAIVLDHEQTPAQDLTVIAADLHGSVRDSLGGLARPRMLVFVDHFGDELRGDERRRALAVLPLSDTPEPKRVAWTQILAAAEHLTGP